MRLNDAPSRAAVAAACGAGALIVVGLALALLALPIQVSDSFGNMLKLAIPWRQLAVQEFTQPSYLRPLLWLQLKAVYELSGGAYYAWFRGVHVLQILLLVSLYLHLARPRSWRDAGAACLGLAVLAGHHTFAGLVNEAFPINTFLTVVLCCFAAAALALGRERRFVNSVLAVAVFVYAALSVESGLLVFVVFAAAALGGARGVPRPGLVALGVALAGYFALRFAVLDVGTPSLTERASGFGFSVLDPPELAAQFGDRRMAFYAYNVAASALSVVFGEPRGGVFRLIDGLRLGAPYPSLVVTAAACTAASALIAAFVIRRAAAWRALQFSHQDRLVLLFLAVWPANAVLSFPYTKDVIMSPAGAFMALAVYAAARELPALAPDGRRALAVAACAALSIAWSLRLLSVHVEMRVAQHKVREEWAYVDDWIALQRLDVAAPAALRLRDALRTDALVVRRPAGELQWARRRVLY